MPVDALELTYATGLTVERNVPVGPFTSLKVGGRADFFTRTRGAEELSRCLSAAHRLEAIKNRVVERREQRRQFAAGGVAHPRGEDSDLIGLAQAVRIAMEIGPQGVGLGGVEDRQVRSAIVGQEIERVFPEHLDCGPCDDRQRAMKPVEPDVRHRVARGIEGRRHPRRRRIDVRRLKGNRLEAIEPFNQGLGCVNYCGDFV